MDFIFNPQQLPYLVNKCMCYRYRSKPLGQYVLI